MIEQKDICVDVGPFKVYVSEAIEPLVRSIAIKSTVDNFLSNVNQAGSEIFVKGRDENGKKVFHLSRRRQAQ